MAECTEVSAYCPVSATVLGYYPNKPLNIFIAVAFGLAAIITLVLGVRKRTWAYMSFIVAGTVLELAGYGGRIALSSNPWNQQAFETQICAIILAPTLICISIYLTLKHLCLAFNPSLSRVRPGLFPFIFVPADVSCLLVQAIGGGIAASAGSSSKNPNPSLLAAGNHAIIAGIALQVVVLLAFGLMSADYYIRARKWIRTGGPDVTDEARTMWNDKRVRMFVGAMLGAYICVQIRCIYRVAEMAGGWGNPIMQDQPSFTVLDSFMMLITVWLLACFPPGIFFPAMVHNSRSGRRRARKEKGGEVETGASPTTTHEGLARNEMEPKEGSGSEQ